MFKVVLAGGTELEFRVSVVRSSVGDLEVSVKQHVLACRARGGGGGGGADIGRCCNPDP